MHNHYIIDGYIDFHPASSTLHDLNNPKNVVVLNSPAARCLLLLIERFGSIVTQHDFLEIVWEKRGMQVSSNTFYQNISILRKGLKKIGLTGNVVVTIPRIGLTLASDTHIKKLTTEQQVEATPESAYLLDEQSLAHRFETIEQLEVTEGLKEPDSLRAFIEKTPYETTKPVKKQTFRLRWILLLSSVVFFALLCVMTLLRGSDDSQYFSNYRFQKTAQGCHIFISNGTSSDKAHSDVLIRSKQFSDDCKNYPWVYITHLPLLPRTSIIRCDKPISEPNTCISDYFFED